MLSGLIRLAVASFIAAAAPCVSFAQEAPATSPTAPLQRRRPPSPPKRLPRRPLRPPLQRLPSPPNRPRPPGEGSTGEMVDLPARPFAYIEGKADRDEIYSAILGSLGLVKHDMEKANVVPGGRPLAVFIESDDTGFKYHAGYPLEAVPDGKSSLSEAVKIGQTPSGKAMRFEHQGAYADIDATYDAITAYLDEKGVDAQDSFVEEYANDVKDADDPTLQVNIYVLLK